MDRPRQRATCSARQYPLSLCGLTVILVLGSGFFLSGCAQLDQLIGKVTGKSANSAESEPGVPPQEQITAHPAEPSTKPVDKTSDGIPAAKAAEEPLPQTPVAAPARPPTAATGALGEPAPEIKKTEQDKTLVEKDQTPKEKKSRATSDRKSRKSAKPKPSTEDVYLPPVPLPSKPAAIGGSGG